MQRLQEQDTLRRASILDYKPIMFGNSVASTIRLEVVQFFSVIVVLHFFV